MQPKNTNKFFRKILSGDRSMTQLQTNVEQAVAQAIKSPLTDGRLIENLALGLTPVRVEHKLSRVPRGYFVVRNNAEAVIWDESISETAPELFLPLRSSAACTVSIWIF